MLQNEFMDSLTRDNRKLDPDPKKDPKLTIDAFILMLQLDELAIRREQRLIRRFLLPAISCMSEFEFLKSITQ